MASRKETPPGTESDLPSLSTTGPGSKHTGSMPTEGTVLGGKYRVEGFIGSGGMGVVIAARALADGRRVAIKCLAREACDDTELLDRFDREARAFERIQNEHVARLLDVGTTADGRPFIVFEHLEGIDVERLLAMRGPLPVGEAARYVVQACAALADAHAANIVHRDIKPSNLFLAKQPDGTTMVKVLDFGISKLTDDPVTRTRAVLGTAIYMSPEQLESSRRVDHRADVWALGVVLYELLTRQVPFEGTALVEIMDAVRANEPRLIRTLRPDLPKALEDLIGKCLRTNPEERYDSVRALSAHLEPFVEEETPAAGAPTPIDAVDEWPRRPSDGRLRIVADSRGGQPPLECVTLTAAAPLAASSSASLPPLQPVRGHSALEFVNYALGAAAVVAAYFLLRSSSAPIPSPPTASTLATAPARLVGEDASILVRPPEELPGD